MREEFEFHVDMETGRLMGTDGLSREEARRRALVAFGGMERYGEEMRDGRGTAWLSGVSLDLRLGVRMLVRYPGLAVVGGLGLAVATTVATVAVGLISSMVNPALPLPGGDRMVMLQNYDTQRQDPNQSTHLHDLDTWRQTLSSVEQLGAFRTVRRNLLEEGATPELVRVAEISPSAFALTRTPPLLGRPLLSSDERAEAGNVVVIGGDAWQGRFGGDPGIVGRRIRLGDEQFTVVGVMPSGYRFPVNHHYWIPLRLEADAYERGAAPPVMVFGRLAEGASLERARSEVATVRHGLASTWPEVYDGILPQVLPYTYPFFAIDKPGIARALLLGRALITLLLVVVGVNVAVLMYARTTTRLGEITVRTALGASRRRIVFQLFAEAFVLSLLAAAIGLAAGSAALGRISAMMQNEFSGEMPFWLTPGLTPGLALYTAGLAVLVAVIIGAVPALKATGRQIATGLRAPGGAGAGGRLGRTWTVLIVGQVAVAVAVLPLALQGAMQATRYGTADPGYEADEYLRAFVSMEQDASQAAETDAPATGEFADAASRLLSALDRDQLVADATFAFHMPGKESTVPVTAGNERASTDSAGGIIWHSVAVNRIAPDYFAAFDKPILAGRAFGAGDAAEAARTAIVSRSFADRVLGGGDVLGRAVRLGGSGASADEQLLEVVGVVPDFPTNDMQDQPYPRLYRALSPAQSFHLIVRTRGIDPTAYTRRLREIAAQTSADLVIDEPIALDDAIEQEQGLMRMIALVVMLATLSVVLLSAAGIYAMTSFAVVRRRREVGIRVALGAPPGQLLRAIFARTAAQLAVGVAVGLVLASALDVGLEGSHAALLPLVAALMVGVGLAAAAGPARRGLRIQPTQALREE